MANPNVAQGTLQRLRASISFSEFPALNITSSYLGKRGITLAFQGDATVYIDTMTGAVTSPEVYLRCVITAHLLKTQSFAQTFVSQLQQLTLLGDATVRPDATTMQPWVIANVSIMGIGDQDFSGADPDFPIRFGGYYSINASLFS